MKTRIETKRLHLLGLTAEQLTLALQDPDRLERQLGIPFSREQLADPVSRAIGMKLSKMSEVAKDRHPWYTYWLIVIAADRFGAGMAGFKGEPDGEGQVEIGYGIDRAYRRQGYMTEAVRALIAWAFEHPACTAVTAEQVLRTNIGSQRVLQTAGMKVYHEDDDTQSWVITRECWAQ